MGILEKALTGFDTYKQKRQLDSKTWEHFAIYWSR